MNLFVYSTPWCLKKRYSGSTELSFDPISTAPKAATCCNLGMVRGGLVEGEGRILGHLGAPSPNPNPSPNPYPNPSPIA